MTEPSQAADSLPPVEAPAGRFFIQLFLVPMLIVAAIVLAWVAVASLASMGTDPDALVKDIERLNSDSWRKSLTLAQQLRDPEQEELRHNEELAGRLATLLDKQVDKGDKKSLSLRIYLCSALGKFEVPIGAEALSKAATTEVTKEDLEVRRAALQGIGTLVEQLPPEETAAHPEMLHAVIEGTEAYGEEGDEKTRRELLRSTATYVLGVFPNEEATERLAELLHDPCLDVGYNAAIGLARRGDARAVPLLSEMLDPPPEALVDNTIAVDSEDPTAERKQAGREAWKRQHIMSSGLRAIAKMRADHPETDIELLRDDVEKLAQDPETPASVDLLAKEVLRAWSR